MAQKTILGIESSARMASVAVMRDGVVVAEKAIEAYHGHGAWIVPLIRDCLNDAGVDRGEITTVLGGCGPGSFTGIRVALAAAKGLMLALGVEGRGICSLQAMAAEGRSKVLPPVNVREQSSTNFKVQQPAVFKAQRHAVAAVVETRRDSYFLGCYHPDGRVLADIAEYEVAAIAPQLQNIHDQWRIIGHIPQGLEAQLHTLGVAAEVVASEPMARHLCRFDAVLAQKTGPLEPIYIAPPLLGTR